MKTIVLKFAGPLQSWGTGSHFEIRHTDIYPSKSAVIGMIAASLGLRREEDGKIKELNNLHYAVRIDQPGRIIKDYHTAHKYKDDGSLDRTYVTQREYIEDAVFIVAIGNENDKWIEGLAKALTSPYFQTYLGRRACPPTFDMFMGIYDSDCLSTIKSIPWSAAVWYKQRNKITSLPIFADYKLLENVNETFRRDKVISFSERGRKFVMRAEGRTSVNIESENNEEHDAFTVV